MSTLDPLPDDDLGTNDGVGDDDVAGIASEGDDVRPAPFAARGSLNRRRAMAVRA